MSEEKSYMELSLLDNVHVLTLTNGMEENRFTEDIIHEYFNVLDRLESFEGNTALVVTSNDSKFWCNGINLNWFLNQPQSYYMKLADLLDRFFLRFALLNMPTIACMTGHTYAGGAILAATFDFRFMREDRGFFCYPEVDIQIPFTPIMHQVLELLPDRSVMTELLLTGKRIGGKEAKEKKIVADVCTAETLQQRSMELAGFLAKKDRKTYTSIKHGMRKPLIDSWKKIHEKL
ncbi:MAG: Fatty acid oxidation complex subunit alpha [Syntrophus sp. SKADARSKE-3]|nr:Fatty acid oxidation complex subunit alpha [Syntrophus sp. SKADARSKE-3]